jgi:hypothetical protein
LCKLIAASSGGRHPTLWASKSRRVILFHGSPVSSSIYLDTVAVQLSLPRFTSCVTKAAKKVSVTDPTGYKVPESARRDVFPFELISAMGGSTVRKSEVESVASDADLVDDFEATRLSIFLDLLTGDRSGIGLVEVVELLKDLLSADFASSA